MLQRTFVGLLAALLVGTLTAPAVALTPQEKMETCKVGADSQKLAGARMLRPAGRSRNKDRKGGT